jgi:hypothetical protein
MSNQIPNWYAPAFLTNVEALLQNPGNKLSPTVQHLTTTGEGARFVNQYGQADPAQRDRPRNGDTPVMDVAMTARWAMPTTVTWATLIDNRDELFTVTQPQSPIVNAAAMEQARQEDAIILNAILGPALVGKSAPVSTRLPAANVLSTDIGGVGSGLNVAKLRSAMQFLMANFNNVSGMAPWMVINASAWRDLMSDVQVTNRDYGGGTPLVNGVLRSFMGINFVITEPDSLPDGGITKLNPATGAALGGALRVLPVYMPDAVTELTWRGLATRIEERPDKNYSTQVWSERVLGAARNQENKVVAVTVTETP